MSGLKNGEVCQSTMGRICRTEFNRMPSVPMGFWEEINHNSINVKVKADLEVSNRHDLVTFKFFAKCEVGRLGGLGGLGRFGRF